MSDVDAEGGTIVLFRDAHPSTGACGATRVGGGPRRGWAISCDTMTDQPTGPSQKVRAAGAALASVAGFALAGPEVGVVLGPALAPYAEQLLDRVREELRGRGGRFFGVAIHASEMAPEDFVEAASGRTELLALLNRVLGYAATALLADKVVALGLTYGKAVGDQAMIDDCTLRADVIGALDGPHLRVLRLLAADVPDRSASNASTNRTTVGRTTSSCRLTMESDE